MGNVGGRALDDGWHTLMRGLVTAHPRLNDLLRGKLGKFSLDALVNLATASGLVLEIRIGEAA